MPFIRVILLIAVTLLASLPICCCTVFASETTPACCHAPPVEEKAPCSCNEKADPIEAKSSGEFLTSLSFKFVENVTHRDSSRNFQFLNAPSASELHSLGGPPSAPPRAQTARNCCAVLAVFLV